MSNIKPRQFYTTYPQSWPGAPGANFVSSSSFPQSDNPINPIDGGDPNWPTSGYQKWPNVVEDKTLTQVSSSQYR